MHVTYIYLPLGSVYPFKKPYRNPMGSFKDPSIHRNKQRKVTLFYTML
jgi:hypothetical protein